MLLPGQLDGMEVGWRSARQHFCAGPQRADHRIDEPVRLDQAGTYHRLLLVERTLHDLDQPVELDQELGKCAVATARTKRTLGHRCVSLSSSVHLLTRDLLEARQAYTIPQSQRVDEVRNGGQRFCRQLVGHDAL